MEVRVGCHDFFVKFDGRTLKRAVLADFCAENVLHTIIYILFQERKKVYNDNPAEVAKDFEKLGFKRLHVVDLDGAKSKHIVNDAVLKAITTETNLTVDFGGGIKTEEDIEKAFAAGASMVTVGSIAVTHPELFMQWMDKYGADKLILGADVRNGKISING